MKPNFEPPVHTLRQILNRNITLYMWPGTYAWKVHFSQSDIPELREIAKTMIITKSWDEFDNLTKHGLLSSGTHTQLTSYMYEFGKSPFSSNVPAEVSAFEVASMKQLSSTVPETKVDLQPKYKKLIEIPFGENLTVGNPLTNSTHPVYRSAEGPFASINFFSMREIFRLMA